MNRRLTRSRDSIVGGVAAGMANWMNTDPALVRIAWAILVPLTAGAALLAYVVAWIVVPEEGRHPEGTTATGEPPSAVEPRQPIDEGRATLIVGAGLVLIGVWFLLRQYVPEIDWSLIWPLILVGVGAAILLGATRRRR